MLHLRQVHAGRQAQPAVQATHPVRVTLGQIIIDRDDMHTFAGQRVQIRRQRSHQGLAFARTHLGNFAKMQHHATHQLDVEMAHL